MKVKEESEKPGLKLNIQKTEIMASGPISSVQFISVAQFCPTLYNPVHCSAPGFPVHHQLLELTQTHVLWVSDAIQPSHPQSSTSFPAFKLCQYQGLFWYHHFMANRWGSIGNSERLYFWGSKVTADGDCGDEMKRFLLLRSKALTNLDSIIKKQRHYFADKGLSTQSYGFSSNHIRIWDLDHKES